MRRRRRKRRGERDFFCFGGEGPVGTWDCIFQGQFGVDCALPGATQLFPLGPLLNFLGQSSKR
eukprot:4659369-Pyramimonas_sp.AAC.1